MFRALTAFGLGHLGVMLVTRGGLAVARLGTENDRSMWAANAGMAAALGVIRAGAVIATSALVVVPMEWMRRTCPRPVVASFLGEAAATVSATGLYLRTVPVVGSRLPAALASVVVWLLPEVVAAVVSGVTASCPAHAGDARCL